MRDRVPILPRLAAVVVLLACTLVLGTAHTAQALDGLAVTSATTYRLDPAAGVVRARADLGFTNTTVDEEDSGVVKRQYYSAFTFPVPIGATSPVATAGDGSSLVVTSQPIEGNTSFFTFTVEFAQPLYTGEHLDVTFTYDIAGLPPRSPDPSRVNPAYVAFTAYGVGDPGAADIRVEVPAGYVIDTIGDDAQMSTAPDGSTVYTADDIAQPDQYALFVSARDDDALVSTPLSVEGADFDVRSWPGDTEWQQFVDAELRAGVPRLGELIGQPWPINDTITVREAFTPYLYGYAGWFSAADDDLEIGEDLDAEVVLHELSHAWFNTQWFDDRWVNEGFAQLVAADAVQASGGVATPAVEPVADDPARIDLIGWQAPDRVQGGEDVETYGYAASYWVIRQIVEHIGPDGMQRVVAAAEADTIAYLGAGPAEADATSTTDWRRLLDLVDELGPSDASSDWSAQPLFAEFVVTIDHLPQLAEREAARERYADLIARSDGWAPPPVVRRAMAEWNFEEATTQMVAATEVLALRDAVDAAATGLGVALADDGRAAYESAVDLVPVRLELENRLDAATLVRRADDREDASPGIVERVGLWGADDDVAAARAGLATGDDDAARDAARRALDTFEHANQRGAQRLAAVATALSLIGITIWSIVRRRRRSDELGSDELGSDELGSDEPGSQATRT